MRTIIGNGRQYIYGKMCVDEVARRLLLDRNSRGVELQESGFLEAGLFIRSM